MVLIQMHRHEWFPPRTALPHLPLGFTRHLHVNKADMRFYAELPRLPYIDNSRCIAMNGSPRKQPYPTYPYVLLVIYT